MNIPNKHKLNVGRSRESLKGATATFKGLEKSFEEQLAFQKKLNADQEILIAKQRAEIEEQRSRMTAAVLALDSQRKQLAKIRVEMSQLQDSIVNEYHPEFGSFWQPGGDGWTIAQERYEAKRLLDKIVARYGQHVLEEAKA